MRYIIILLLFSSLFADDYKSHSERHINKELSHLDMSKEQNMEVREILQEFRIQLKEFKEFKEEMQSKRKELFLKESLDNKELDILNNIIDNKAHNIEKNFLQKMHAVLTPKQRKKFIHYFDDWEVE